MILSWLIAPRTKGETVLYARVTHAMFLLAVALALVGFGAALAAAVVAPSIAPLAAIMLTGGALLVSLYFGLRFSATWLVVGYIGRAARMYSLIAALAFVVGVCVLLLTAFLVSGTFGWVVLVINCLSLVALAACLAIAVHWGIGL